MTITGNIGNNDSDIIKLAAIIADPSILSSSGERCLPVFVLSLQEQQEL